MENKTKLTDFRSSVEPGHQIGSDFLFMQTSRRTEITQFQMMLRLVYLKIYKLSRSFTMIILKVIFTFKIKNLDSRKDHIVFKRNNGDRKKKTF